MPCPQVGVYFLISVRRDGVYTASSSERTLISWLGVCALCPIRDGFSSRGLASAYVPCAHGLGPCFSKKRHFQTWRFAK